MKVIYMKGDIEGECCAAMVKHLKDSTVEFVPIEDEEDVRMDSNLSGGRVYIVGITFSEPVMLALEQRCEVVWLPGGGGHLRRKMSAGCLLDDPVKVWAMWSHLSEDAKGFPYVAILLGANKHDKNRDGGILRLGLSVNHTEPDSPLWPYLFECDEDSGVVERLLADGKAIFKYKELLEKREEKMKLK